MKLVGNDSQVDRRLIRDGFIGCWSNPMRSGDPDLRRSRT